MKRAHQAWPEAYRPLRPATLLAQLGVFVLAEVVLFRAYSLHDSRFHYATHLLVAVIATAAYQSALLLVAARPARGQVMSLLGFHLVAMWPDLAFRGGLPHAGWMDWLALGHIHVHYLPGGTRTWLVLAALSLLGYGELLAAWLRARGREAEAGLPPALGIGGTAVWRAQLDPRAHDLARVQRGPGPTEDDQPLLVLVHGLGATSAFWSPVQDLLDVAGRTSVAVDLLGHGGSRGTGTRFLLQDQAAALTRLLGQLPGPVHLVAHSYGCVVAGRVAVDRPDLFARLTLVSPAVFPDLARAQQRIGEHSWLARRTIEGAPVASVACGAMCLLRPLLGPMAGHARPDLPESVARGGMEHSFPAYRDGLTSMWHDNPLPSVLARPPVPTDLVLAEDDETVVSDEVLSLPRAAQVVVHRVPGTHLMPVQVPATCVAALLGAATAAPGGH